MVRKTHQVLVGKLFGEDFLCVKCSEGKMGSVNNGDKFFEAHRLFVLIPILFTGCFLHVMEAFASAINSDKVANGSVGDVGEEDNRKEELFKKEGSAQAKYESDKGTEAGLCLPIDVLETGVRDIAYHEEGDRQHEGRDQECEPA